MYKSTYRCSDCKHVFEKLTKNFPKRDPACPKCKEAKKVRFKSSVSDKTHNIVQDSRVDEINQSRKAPSMGASTRTQAIDKTAEIVMQDYGMTDVNLGTNLREGDNCAPKLRPDLEQKVDKIFAPQKPIMGQDNANNLNNTLMKQINAGAFKSSYGGQQNDVVWRQQNSGIRKPTVPLFEYNGKEPPAR